MNQRANSLKWLMRFYPPMLFGGIWISSISEDFSHAEVRVFKSMLNMNFNKSIFGGTIFSAADPFFALMVWAWFRRRGKPVKIWMKSASVQFIKPAISSLTLHFEIKPEEFLEAEKVIDRGEKFVYTFEVRALKKDGEVAAIIQNEVYARRLENKPEKNQTAG